VTRQRKTATELRSHRWFGRDDLRSFGHRSRAKQSGFSEEDLAGKPVIAILNTWSDANPCHAHFRLRAEEVKRGIWQAGGFPMEIPLLTLGETLMKPTTMLYRNLLAMEAEEALRSYPADGAVLLGGCDKTVPALLMGATSANLPAIFVPAGAMLRGNWRGPGSPSSSRERPSLLRRASGKNKIGNIKFFYAFQKINKRGKIVFKIIQRFFNRLSYRFVCRKMYNTTYIFILLKHCKRFIKIF